MGKIITILFFILLMGVSIYSYRYVNQQIIIGEKKLAAGENAYRRGEYALRVGKQKYAAGQKELAQGKQKYDTAKALTAPISPITILVPDIVPGASLILGHTQRQIQAGGRKIKAGEAQLASGARQIRDGERKLADGRRALENGKKELAFAKRIRHGLEMCIYIFGIIAFLLIIAWRKTFYRKKK
ncbi:MAG TPA: hypothetical protein VJK30_05645 [Coxiellaceae bacterium]|nr:MAG: hypothetical protein A3E81_01285 [Gammaproteobacteria bacterium RIFCSPHIGHO2_12_FULL_36_30]HLB56794.1 hypothetical protein [Coxiellaceae bacterium]